MRAVRPPRKVNQIAVSHFSVPIRPVLISASNCFVAILHPLRHKCLQSISVQNSSLTLDDALQRTDTFLVVAYFLASPLCQMQIMVENLVAAVPGNGLELGN